MRQPWPRATDTRPRSQPPAPPDSWGSLIGEYASASKTLSVFEDDGQMYLAVGGSAVEWQDRFDTQTGALVDRRDLTLRFDRSASGDVIASLGQDAFLRLPLPDDPSAQMSVATQADLEDVVRRARLSDVPHEVGEYLPSDLVDLTSFDASIDLDVRYATTHNFLGYAFYPHPLAWLQREVAAAVVAAHHTLCEAGYGLIVLDAYRPWFVSKAFWDAVPEASRWLVADPARGSKHNRGCAIDVTLRDLNTGAAVEMPSTFDEPSYRAYAFYPGGTSLRRWHRDRLRGAMEREGFVVNPYEWWHFDHAAWPRYRMENRPLE